MKSAPGLHNSVSGRVAVTLIGRGFPRVIAPQPRAVLAPRAYPARGFFVGRPTSTGLPVAVGCAVMATSDRPRVLLQTGGAVPCPALGPINFARGVFCPRFRLRVCFCGDWFATSRFRAWTFHNARPCPALGPPDAGLFWGALSPPQVCQLPPPPQAAKWDADAWSRSCGMRVEPIATQLTLTRSPLTLALEPAPDRAIIRAIASGLDTHNALFTPLAGWTPHWIIGRDEGHAVQAGVQFIISLDWLFLRWLWVAEPHRKLGIGSQLLSGAEETARKSDCRAAYVDTFQFQAPEFYERHGYREFARLLDFPRGHPRVWLSKLL